MISSALPLVFQGGIGRGTATRAEGDTCLLNHVIPSSLLLLIGGVVAIYGNGDTACTSQPWRRGVSFGNTAHLFNGRKGIIVGMGWRCIAACAHTVMMMQSARVCSCRPDAKGRVAYTRRGDVWFEGFGR